MDIRSQLINAVNGRTDQNSVRKKIEIETVI